MIQLGGQAYALLLVQVKGILLIPIPFCTPVTIYLVGLIYFLKSTFKNKVEKKKERERKKEKNEKNRKKKTK